MMCGSRGNSSVGRARPCQGRGREFESRFPLHIQMATDRPSCLAAASMKPRAARGFCFFGVARLSLRRPAFTDGQVAEWSCSGLQSRVRRFDSDLGLHPVLLRPSMSAEITLRPFVAALPNFVRASMRAKITKRSARPYFSRSPSPGGEIGRRKGLKIPRL